MIYDRNDKIQHFIIIFTILKSRRGNTLDGLEFQILVVKVYGKFMRTYIAAKILNTFLYVLPLICAKLYRRML